MDEDENIPQEFQTNIKCPTCGEDMFLIYYSTEIAFEEGINIETYYCKKCLYKQSSVSPRERGDPVHTSLKINRPDDLKVVVYRSPEAIIQIPEIEAEILPGNAAHGEITTVEGILYRMKEKIEIMEQDPEDSRIAQKVKESLEIILNGGKPDITVVIEDPSGKSRINSSRALRREMEPRD